MIRRNAINPKRAAARQGWSWRSLLQRKSLWRCAWLLLFVMHLPATLKVYGSATAIGEPTAWSSLILLAVTNLFFILEITFAWSLRVLSDRRCLIAFLLIVALMHAGVLDRVMPDAVAGHGIGILLFVSTAFALVVLAALSLVRQALAAFDAAGLSRLIALLRRRYSLAVFAVVRVPKLAPHRHACAHRAPPHC
ncbi:MAG TPA: hypothetical protein P5081_11545 [Phycisphaerae bacterium]|nr:hypothetical protein [Phycisphaerae bacterium]HRW53514.1 hypothetical protein [Phycisphaerae bacterium]